eukprot:g1567.t1
MTLSSTNPFLTVYVVHSGYSVFLVVPIARRLYNYYRRRRSLSSGTDIDDVDDDDDDRMLPATPALLSRRMLAGAFVLTVLWTSSAVLWFISLHMTLVSVNNTLFQTSAVFVYALSVPILGERIRASKVISVLVSVAGLVLVIFYSADLNDNAGDDDQQQTAAGYIFLCISIALFAAYEVAIKKTLGAKGTIEDSLGLLGLVGIFTALFTWPGVFIESAIVAGGSEAFSELVDGGQVSLLLLNMGLDAVMNGALFGAIALVTPLFATMGLMLLIPTGIIVDALTLHVQWHPGAYAGTACIFLGFIILAASDILRAKTTKKKKKKTDSLLFAPHLV